MTDYVSVLVYFGIFGVIVLLPIMYGVHEAYRDRRELIKIYQEIDQSGKPAPPDQSGKKTRPDQSSKNVPPKEEKASDVLDKLLAAPEGISGLGRQTMTIGVLAVMAIGMIQLLISATTLVVPSTIAPNSASYNQTLAYVSQTASSELDIVKSLVTILGGAVSAMIGFYFGARASESTQGGTQTTTTGVTPTPAR